jgi:lysozyme family protein
MSALPLHPLPLGGGLAFFPEDVEAACRRLEQDLNGVPHVRGVTVRADDPTSIAFVVWLHPQAPPTKLPEFVTVATRTLPNEARVFEYPRHLAVPVDVVRSAAPMDGPTPRTLRIDPRPKNSGGSSFRGLPTATWLADGGVEAWLRRVDVSPDRGAEPVDASFVAHAGGHDPYPMGGSLPVHARYEVWVQEGTNAFPLREALQVDDRPRTYRLIRRTGQAPRYTWTADDVPMVLNTAGKPWWIVADDVFGAAGRFAAVLPVILRAEGGVSDNPNDRGGHTDRGITHGTWSAWLAAHHQPARDVTTATDAEVAQIYREGYWDKVRGDLLPEPLDLVMFDSAVNMGPHTPIKFLQRALGVSDDGSIGTDTLTALRARDPREVAHKVLDQRVSFYHYQAEHVAGQRGFLRGWLARIERLRSLVGGTRRPPTRTSTPTRGDSGEGGGGAGILVGLGLLLAALFFL